MDDPSRRSWTGIVFRPRIAIERDGIRFTRRRLLTSEELFVPFSRITSLYVRSGLILADVEIHTTGQSQPITTRLFKKDAAMLRAEVDARL